MPNSTADMPPEMMALVGAALAATGGPLTFEEAKQFGSTEPICSVGPGGKVEVHPRIKKIRRRAMRKATRRPLLRHSAPRTIGRQPRARAPRRRRAVGARTAASRDGPSDPDGDRSAPLTAAFFNIAADRGFRRHGGVLPVTSHDGPCHICGLARCQTRTFCYVSRALDALRNTQCRGRA